MEVTGDAALTANDANYATITVQKRPVAAPGTPTSVVAADTDTAGTGDWAAWTPVPLGALANASFVAGDVFTVTVAKEGSGVSLPDLLLTLNYKRTA